jgi:hypothetical protein
MACESVLLSAILGGMPARDRNLPRGLAWPLTATDVSDAVRIPLGGTSVNDLRFLTRDGDDTVLYVEWVPRRPSNYGHGGGLFGGVPGFRISVCPVPAAERAAAREILRGEALPQLDAWIAEASRASESWLATRQRCFWRLTEGRLIRQAEG